MKMVRTKTQVAAKQEGEEGGLLGQYVRTFGNLKYLLLVQICKGFCEAIYRDLLPHNLGTFLWILIRQRGVIY